MLNNQQIPIIIYVYALIMFYVIELNPARRFSTLSFHIERTPSGNRPTTGWPVKMISAYRNAQSMSPSRQPRYRRDD